MSLEILCVFLLFSFSVNGAHFRGLVRRDGDLGCLYGNVFERVGTTFASRDGCNTCTCSISGMSCTTKICGSGVQGNCVLNGVVHYAGRTWLAADGCNTCTCTGGQAACTQFVCGTTHRPIIAASCTVSGMTYTNGMTWQAADGCNTCVCIRGQVTCTQFNCSRNTNPPLRVCYVKGSPMQPGQTWAAPDGCNRCTCNNGYITCTKNSCTNTNPNNPNIHTGVTCYDNIAHLFHPEGHSWNNKCGSCNCNQGITICTNPNVSPECPGYYGSGGASTSAPVVGTGTYCYDPQTKVSYSEGQSFKAPDGCNDCACLRGVILCSKGNCNFIG